ncbi:unnamed protein product [Rotaria sp. Silwood1]|nr:unnamed protein product [Rotaria sp. Silwood1]
MEYTASFISSPIRLWLFLTALIPSIFCSIIVLYHLLSKRTQRRAINNHVIIILLFNNLIYEFIDIPLLLNFYRLQSVWSATPSLCVMWMFIDETLNSISTILIAWASVERYIIIFRSQWLSSARKRFLIHYLPLMLFVLYIIIFHVIVILFSSCINMYDYTREKCGESLCLHNTKLIETWNIIVNEILPGLIIVIFSIALLVRCLLQNHRIHQRLQWRKYRKMAIQLLSISMLYFILYIPVTSIKLVQLCCISQDGINSFEEYARFFSYYIIFLLPFVCYVSLPEVKWQFKKIFPCCHRQARLIHPRKMPVMHFVTK